jgi:hypothetical protein
MHARGFLMIGTEATVVSVPFYPHHTMLGHSGQTVKIPAKMLIGIVMWFRGQAEKEFKVEVEAIGKVRHKHLVGLIGYCAEGAKR